MLPFIPFEDVAKVELICTYASQFVENVLHFHKTSPGISVSDLNSLAAYLLSIWNNKIQPHVSDVVSLVNVRATDLTTESGAVIEYTTGLPLVGAQAGAPNPTNAALVTKLMTGLRGRSYRGRIYNFGWPAIDNTNATTAGGPATTFSTAWDYLLDNPPTDFEWVVASSWHNGARRTVGVATPIIAVSTNIHIDSQRRRLAERGT